MTKTIFALATPDSVSAIGIIRISGPKTSCFKYYMWLWFIKLYKKREFSLKKFTLRIKNY